MKNTNVIVREFNSRRDIYKDYCGVVIRLLESLLKNEKFKYQLSHRIKSLDSIKEKIKRKSQSGKIYHHLEDIEDIAGVRVVFYTKADREYFIKKLKKAIGDGYLRLEKTTKVSGYRSTHAIISFGPERIRLAEYAPFKGMRCEIQMTLILDHAWAEVEHDILYKEGASVHGLNKKTYHDLREKMEKVMSDYIQKASTGLEAIVHNIKKLELSR